MAGGVPFVPTEFVLTAFGCTCVSAGLVAGLVKGVEEGGMVTTEGTEATESGAAFD